MLPMLESTDLLTGPWPLQYSMFSVTLKQMSGSCLLLWSSCGNSVYFSARHTRCGLSCCVWLR